MAGVAFALQSGPVIGPQLGPVPHYNTSRNIGHCGVFSTSTATVGDTVVSFMQHPVHGKVVICVTVKYCLTIKVPKSQNYCLQISVSVMGCDVKFLGV